MDSILEFWNQMTANPLLFIAVTLTLSVILVNGWTDAPNAIATCVVTRCMPPKAAILMAAVFNFLGVFVMTLLNATVAETITKMVDFGTDPDQAINALSAALFAIVLWVVAIVMEVLALLVVLGKINLKFMPTLYQLIAFLVLDLICVIIGAQLWKKANRILKIKSLRLHWNVTSMRQI